MQGYYFSKPMTAEDIENKYFSNKSIVIYKKGE